MAQPAANPFIDMDFTKLAADFQMPGIDMQAMMESQRRNMDAITKANSTAIECSQTLARRQADMMREMVEEASAMMKGLMAEGAPEDKVARNADLFRAAFERNVAHMRELSDMVAKANSEAVEVLSRRVAESLTELKKQVEAAKK